MSNVYISAEISDCVRFTRSDAGTATPSPTSVRLGAEVACRAHNPEVGGSNPPAEKQNFISPFFPNCVSFPEIFKVLVGISRETGFCKDMYKRREKRDE